MSKSSVIINGEDISEVKDFECEGNENNSSPTKGNACKHLETFNASKDNKTGPLAVNGNFEFDHIYASNHTNENCSDKNSEAVKLKELLLLHLDLIQQQSEQLVTKDKKITALKQENNLLKLRLERMDRRVSLKKHKGSLRVEASNNSSVQEEDPEPDTAITDLLTPVGAEDTNHVGRRRKKDEKLSGHGSVCNSGPRNRNRTLSLTSSVNSADTTSVPKVNGGKVVKRERRREYTKKKRAKKGSSLEKAVENILTTDSPYYTPVGDSDHIWTVDEEPVVGCVLEVPSWRVKVFTSCYTMEGTENLSEDVFDRRHSRLEIDERRRKRWDVQRIREQRQIEKLKKGGRKRRRGSSEEEEEMESLWPSPEQAEYLQVEDAIPVAAFGCPLSKINNADSEFTLPWVNDKDYGRSPNFISPKKR